MRFSSRHIHSVYASQDSQQGKQTGAEVSLSHDSPEEGKSEQGEPECSYAAPTDIDTQATNIATERRGATS